MNLFDKIFLRNNGKKIKRYDRYDFWAVPVDLSYCQDQLTEEKLNKIEGFIGFKLPAEYVRLLRIQNGGYVKKKGFEGLRILYGIGKEYPNLQHETDRFRTEFGDTHQANKLVPIDGDGHSFICLDYRTSSAPKVVWIDFECDEENILSNSFYDYIINDELTKEEVEHLQKANKYTISATVIEVKSLIENHPQLHALYMGYEISGYDHIRVDDASFKVVCSIKDISVRKGFIRKSDQRYETLKDLMPEQVQRIDAPKGHKSEIDVSNLGSMKLVFELLQNKGIEIEKIK